MFHTVIRCRLADLLAHLYAALFSTSIIIATVLSCISAGTGSTSNGGNGELQNFLQSSTSSCAVFAFHAPLPATQKAADVCRRTHWQHRCSWLNLHIHLHSTYICTAYRAPSFLSHTQQLRDPDCLTCGSVTFNNMVPTSRGRSTHVSLHRISDLAWSRSHGQIS